MPRKPGRNVISSCINDDTGSVTVCKSLPPIIALRVETRDPIDRRFIGSFRRISVALCVIPDDSDSALLRLSAGI